MAPSYRVRFFFEWGGGCLWYGDDGTRDRFGFGPIEGKLPLSSATRQRIAGLGAWHDRSLNWAYSPDPGPWRQEECDRFNAAVKALLEAIRRELGEAYEVFNEQSELQEDPDLDAYLANQGGFRRK